MQRKGVNSRQGNEVQKPDIHFGTVASGHVVMKSGEERDRIAKRIKLLHLRWREPESGITFLALSSKEFAIMQTVIRIRSGRTLRLLPQLPQ
jgi:hypothetical protein